MFKFASLATIIFAQTIMVINSLMLKKVIIFLTGSTPETMQEALSKIQNYEIKSVHLLLAQ